MKAVILIALIAVAATLASAGAAMLRHRPSRQGPDPRMARALAWRVGLSIAIFLFVLLAWHLGWIAPTGLPLGR